MLESLHHACGCLLIPNFRASLVLPEHQSLAEHCSADEEITKGQYMAGNGLGSFRGVNVWIRKTIGNYEQYGTRDGSRINLYLAAYSLVSISSAPSPVSPMGRNVRGRGLPWGGGRRTCCPSSLPPITDLPPGAAGLRPRTDSGGCLLCR